MVNDSVLLVPITLFFLYGCLLLVAVIFLLTIIQNLKVRKFEDGVILGCGTWDRGIWHPLCGLHPRSLTVPCSCTRRLANGA